MKQLIRILTLRKKLDFLEQKFNLFTHFRFTGLIEVKFHYVSKSGQIQHQNDGSLKKISNFYIFQKGENKIPCEE